MAKTRKLAKALDTCWRCQATVVRQAMAIAILSVAIFPSNASTQEVEVGAVGKRSPQSTSKAAAPDVPASEAGGPRLGMNLSAMSDWNREWVFVDLFKSARPWIAQHVGGAGPWDTQAKLQLNDGGWPLLASGQAAATLMCRDSGGHYPAGHYVCTYDGQGEVFLGFDAHVVSTTPGRIMFDVTPSDGGILLRIDRSTRTDPVRNIRVFMPGCEHAQSPFHPLFVERLRPFKVLRFMDWGAINNSSVTSWSQRNTPSSIRQTGPGGVSIEYMIDLCNELHVDPWFCMPHLADDEYVRQFAQLVRERLHPDARVYVEWSNEAWNSIFEQAKWVQQQSRSRAVEWTTVIADEAARDWKIWQTVFNGNDRLIRVAAGQLYNPWVCQSLAERLQGEFDALACAPYFYAETDDIARFTAATSAEAILDSCLRNIDGTCSTLLTKHRQLADVWSKRKGRTIPLLAYEAGQHLTSAGAQQPYSAAYLAAQTNPRMGTAYEHLFAVLRKNNVRLVTAFNYVGAQGPHGSWGHLRYQDEPVEDSPKFRALLNAELQTATAGR